MTDALRHEDLLRDEILRGLRGAGYPCSPAQHDGEERIPGLVVGLGDGRQMLVFVSKPGPAFMELEPVDPFGEDLDQVGGPGL